MLYNYWPGQPNVFILLGIVLAPSYRECRCNLIPRARGRMCAVPEPIYVEFSTHVLPTVARIST